MRGRGGHSSSSVSQEQTRMALKLNDASDIPSGSQLVDENTQEDEALDDRDDNVELSSSLLSPASREKRKRETENKSKEMTEEEMMDLALRLSEQEASVHALRVQQEEEAMMKAIQESMVNSQTQPSQSRRPLTNSEASLSIFSRRKLLYANMKTTSPINRIAAEDVCTSETDLNRGAKGAGDESINRLKKRKRKEASPPLEMPDLSEAQKISSQASPCSSECLSVSLDSPQSCDSTQIDDYQLHKSPVFPSTDRKAKVHVPRLSQDLVEACRTSGFVFCSPDSLTSTRKSQTAQAMSPTFPKSPKRSNNPTSSKSPVFLETDQGDDGDTDQSPEYFKSPVFGRNARHETSPSACKPQDGVCNSGSCSEESLTSPVSSTSRRPKSPVFPKSPGLPKNLLPSPETSATCKSPVFSETVGVQTEQSRGSCTSPVFGRIGRRRKIHQDEQKHAADPSAAELRGSDSDGNSTTTGSPSQGLRQDGKTDHNQDATFKSSKSDDDDEELNNVSKDSSAETELTSDMTLLWSDNDDIVTPVGSPSPVFPEERPVHQADGEDASQNHVTAASPGYCRPSTSSTSTSGQQPSTAERGPRPISSQGSVSMAPAPPREPAGGPTVHYYWGVPFCPRGVDPDEYTQVILGHMEVYEKSLKQAQRRLLRKAEWGEAVLPQREKSPSPESPAESPQQLVSRRRGLRLRSKNVAADTLSAEAEEDEEDKKDEEEEREGKEEEEEEEEEEEKKEGEEGQGDTDDCEVCPETQLSDDDDRTQDLLMEPDAGAELGFQFASKKSPEPPEVEMILQVDSPAGDELQEEEEEMEVEVDAAVNGKTEGNIPVSSRDVGGQHVRKDRMKEDEGDPDVEEIGDPDIEEIKDPVLRRSTSPRLQPAALLQNAETKVNCPICQGSFPVTEIERHAAYCDGEVAVVEERMPEEVCFQGDGNTLHGCKRQVSLKPRRKRTRRAEATAEVTYEPSNTGKNQEKCYICQKYVPLRDYSRHTEVCIQRQASKTTAKGNLLSALEQTEGRDSEAGPSGSKLQLGDVIDLRDDDDDEEEEEEEGGSVSALRIGNSPIRAFTPISEATGCLIDFKKQQRAKTLRQRRR